jgi:hypothetical protein
MLLEALRGPIGQTPDISWSRGRALEVRGPVAVWSDQATLTRFVAFAYNTVRVA